MFLTQLHIAKTSAETFRNSIFFATAKRSRCQIFAAWWARRSVEGNISSKKLFFFFVTWVTTLIVRWGWFGFIIRFPLKKNKEVRKVTTKQIVSFFFSYIVCFAGRIWCNSKNCRYLFLLHLFKSWTLRWNFFRLWVLLLPYSSSFLLQIRRNLAFPLPP